MRSTVASSFLLGFNGCYTRMEGAWLANAYRKCFQIDSPIKENRDTWYTRHVRAQSVNWWRVRENGSLSVVRQNCSFQKGKVSKSPCP